MKKKVLIIIKTQFGYHTDYLKYCKYLNNDFDLTFFCVDSNLPRKEVDNVKVVYVSLKGNLIQRAIQIFSKLNRLNEGYDITMVKSFEFCFLTRLFVKSDKYILDIRSGDVSHKRLKRLYRNSMIRINLMFFENVSIISEGLADFFRIKNYLLLPLGSEVLSTTNKSFAQFKLLYVGTLDNRNIHETIEGVSLFLNSFEDALLSYDIFGMGSKREEELVIEYIDKFKLNDRVRFHGRKSHDEIQSYYDNCNVGVSYVPLEPYYEYQPPTKTFEYLFSGMICLGTSTKANAEIIESNTGALCKDDPNSFSNGLKDLYSRRFSFESIAIRSSRKENNWETICTSVLKPFLNQL